MDETTARKLAAALEAFYRECHQVLNAAAGTMSSERHALLLRSVAHVIATAHDELGTPVYYLYPELTPEDLRGAKVTEVAEWATGEPRHCCCTLPKR